MVPCQAEDDIFNNCHAYKSTELSERKKHSEVRKRKEEREEEKGKKKERQRERERDRERERERKRKRERWRVRLRDRESGDWRHESTKYVHIER